MVKLVPLLLVVASAAGLVLLGRGAESRRAAPVVLVIHGGSGALPRKQMTPAREKKYRAALEEALRAGYRALQRPGGTGLDAVEAAIRVMEDSPLFNAGKGAVFTRDGRNELDASVMEGKGRRAGAVANVTCVKNPISAARAVLEKSPHVLLVGPGADKFARRARLEIVDPSYFKTDERWREWQEYRAKDKKQGGLAPAPRERGTVGAVALDRQGNLAAGTSTGGLAYRLPGRVGDSPIIGAGTYADNAACAVSCTGYGELFIRHAVAHEVAALMKYRKLSVRDAAERALGELPQEPGGVGGLIALDAAGNAAMPYNTEGMYRGQMRDGTLSVAIYER